MSYTTPDFADTVIGMLMADGYQVHGGILKGEDITPQADPSENCDVFWFTWSVAGMSDCEVGKSCDSPLKAWISALAHRLDNSAIPMDAAAACGAVQRPFDAATIPP